ncbi:hypothetical protein EIN_412370 [Entamoeba invadens IP1]|uniref:VWFA domain-containing protein n=1 Tax=Entamoeba invadens IP1 TaxID=370355 RepID=A0A0A1UFG5_ENTIV|nr:hypothetical protein EIN_412370 [Entamoeba invadens IP1]ELP95368.1 hypothetical protein EIN_412370 [Entamoeba invadens IP1]|eukprot:XP_004262139.1 hypothetical protein EIN_412370 [Entamoeba invadens IP1]
MSELDLVFLCDTTGSMSSYLHAAQQSIESIITTITQKEKCDVQFALVEYRDHPPQDDTFATRVTQFTSSMKTIKTAVNQMQAQGGGDTPESVSCGLYEVTKLEYRQNASKVLVWIADAPPHGFGCCGDGFPDGCPCGKDFIEVLRECMKKDIVIYSVGAEPLSVPYFRTLMRATSQLTGGQYAALSSASVLGDLITNGAIEEIQMKKIFEDVKAELAKSPDFAALPPNEKAEKVKEEVKKQTDGRQIETVQIDSIFKDELKDVPSIFLTCENLKQLRTEMVKESDIAVTFKDNFIGGERDTLSIADDMLMMDKCCMAMPMEKCVKKKTTSARGGFFGSFFSSKDKERKEKEIVRSKRSEPEMTAPMEQTVSSVSMKATENQSARLEQRAMNFYM